MSGCRVRVRTDEVDAADEVEPYTTDVSALATARLLAVLIPLAHLAAHDGAPHV